MSVRDLRRQIDQGGLIDYNLSIGAATSGVDSPGLDVNNGLVGNSRHSFNQRIRSAKLVNVLIAVLAMPHEANSERLSV